MPAQYLDILGLSTYGASDELTAVASASFPSATPLSSAAERMDLLLRLRNGAGVQIITGPLGREFWMIVGLEVQVTVWPDGYDESERWDEFLWAWLVSGGKYEDGKAIRSSHHVKGKTPTPKHKLYAQWHRALEMLDVLAAGAGVEQLVIEDRPFEVVTPEAGRARLLANPAEILSIDFEWHRKTQDIVGMAVSDLWNEDDNVYAAVRGSDVDEGPYGESRVRDALTTFARSGRRAVGHGLRADLGVVYDGDPAELLNEGIDYRFDDTMGMAFMLNELHLGLKPLSRKYLDRDPIENKHEWADMPARMTARYAAAGDTRNTADLYKVFDKLLTGRQREIYDNVERPLVPLIASMEKYGVPCDIEETKRQYRKFTAIQYGLRRSVQDIYGYDLSTPDGQADFVASFGFARPTSLDQRVLGLNPHWCVDLILEFNQARTRAQKFLRPILARWNRAGRPVDFRLYTRFNQFAREDDSDTLAPSTGRLSSSGHKSPPPTGASGDNLQNKPRDIRDIYRAPEGCLWWSFDYDSLEIRIAAALSRDPEMLRSLEPGDPGLHTRFRNYITETTGKDVGRPAAKTGNFEQLYEGGANQLMTILAKQRSFINLETAQLIVDSHHELFKTYHEAGRGWVEEARANGCKATTYEGRERYLPNLNHSDAQMRSEAERAAQNHKVQGTAADVIKRAMIRCQRVLARYGGHMALQVHDELDGWVPATVDQEAFIADMQAALQYEINGVTLSVAGGLGQTWGEAH